MQAQSTRSNAHDPAQAGSADAIHEAEERAGRERHPARRWQDVVELARVELAEALARSIGSGRFDRRCYQNWLAMESAACRIGALSLDAVACWHSSQTALLATARNWANDLREDAQAAARDVRVLDGMAAAPPAALGQWHAFAGAAGGSQRAGEVLGAVLLHGQLLGGPMRAVAAAIGALPFALGGHYLPRRAQAGYATEAGCDLLLDAYAATALAVGAQRAAGWYRAAMVEILRPTPE